ncbi:MAG TPA: hypothetical protein VFH51_02470 [Myxococcota bacterium]|nr:hypothetical protein [Myxococcota bacterium]
MLVPTPPRAASPWIAEPAPSRPASPLPQGFIDPCTGEPFEKGPITLAPDGWSYGEEALKRWVAQHGPASPKTGQPLPARPAVHNDRLRRTYEHYTSGRLPGAPAGHKDDWQTAVLCPISKDPMQKPVRLSDGEDYDQDSALTLLQTRDTSPLTGHPYEALERLIPDRAMQLLSAEVEGFDATVCPYEERIVTPQVPAHLTEPSRVTAGLLQYLRDIEMTQGRWRTARSVREWRATLGVTDAVLTHLEGELHRASDRPSLAPYRALAQDARAEVNRRRIVAEQMGHDITLTRGTLTLLSQVVGFHLGLSATRAAMLELFSMEVSAPLAHVVVGRHFGQLDARAPMPRLSVPRFLLAHAVQKACVASLLMMWTLPAIYPAEAGIVLPFSSAWNARLQGVYDSGVFASGVSFGLLVGFTYAFTLAVTRLDVV